MKNVVHNIKKKWIGPLKGTVLGEWGSGPASRLPETENNTESPSLPSIADGQLAMQLLEPQDWPDHIPAGASGVVLPNQQAGDVSRKYNNNADGILFA